MDIAPVTVERFHMYIECMHGVEVISGMWNGYGTYLLHHKTVQVTNHQVTTLSD